MSKGGTDWPRMAEDVASRVAGAEALPPELWERVERAAARLGSIHERWSTSEPAEPTAPRSTGEKGGAAAEDSVPSSEDDALPLNREAVSVTPILGVEMDESDEAGRPRFKTLMGVPRSSPELDELAGLDSSSGHHDSVPIERSTSRPPAAAASSERASPRVDEAPSLAGTSVAWEPGAAHAASARSSPQPWPSLAVSSLDVSAEVSALRKVSRWRPRWIGLGAIAAAAAVFAIAAQRPRALALRWLEGEDRARLRPAAGAISDTAQALRPGANAATSTSSASDRVAAQLEPPVAILPRATGEPAADQASGNAASEADETSDVSAKHSSSGAPSGATKSKQAARDARSGGTTSRARAQVAAPRKPSQRSDSHQTGSATKARATRQNTPRKDSGSGIIRETPF